MLTGLRQNNIFFTTFYLDANSAKLRSILITLVSKYLNEAETNLNETAKFFS